MKVLNFVKLTLLSTALSQVSLFADIYKLEVTNDKQTIRFCVYNLTRNYSDWFSVKKVGSSYESGDGAIGGCIWDTQVDIGVGFNFGSFRANLDDKNNRLQLCGGCFADALLLEKTDYPIVVTNGSALQANTLVAKKAIFKNEGVLETFVTILQDCLTVENKGKFHARNLFLFKTHIQNYDMVQWDDAFKAVAGSIIPKAANSDFPKKKGFIRTGMPTRNTRVLSLHKTYHGKTCARRSSPTGGTDGRKF